MRAATSSILLLACGMAFAAPPLGAQEEEAIAPEPVEDRAAPEEEPAADAELPPSPDRFDPSEEISLDLPVSFPVDI